MQSRAGSALTICKTGKGGRRAKTVSPTVLRMLNRMVGGQLYLSELFVNALIRRGLDKGVLSKLPRQSHM